MTPAAASSPASSRNWVRLPSGDRVSSQCQRRTPAHVPGSRDAASAGADEVRLDLARRPRAAVVADVLDDRPIHRPQGSARRVDRQQATGTAAICVPGSIRSTVGQVGERRRPDANARRVRIAVGRDVVEELATRRLHPAGRLASEDWSAAWTAERPGSAPSAGRAASRQSRERLDEAPASARRPARRASPPDSTTGLDRQLVVGRDSRDWRTSAGHAGGSGSRAHRPSSTRILPADRATPASRCAIGLVVEDERSHPGEPALHRVERASNHRQLLGPGCHPHSAQGHDGDDDPAPAVADEQVEHALPGSASTLWNSASKPMASAARPSQSRCEWMRVSSKKKVRRRRARRGTSTPASASTAWAYDQGMGDRADAADAFDEREVLVVGAALRLGLDAPVHVAEARHDVGHHLVLEASSSSWIGSARTGCCGPNGHDVVGTGHRPSSPSGAACTSMPRTVPRPSPGAVDVDRQPSGTARSRGRGGRA